MAIPIGSFLLSSELNKVDFREEADCHILYDDVLIYDMMHSRIKLP